MVNINSIFNFIKTLKDPKNIKMLSDEELKRIVTDVNYRFIKKMKSEKYQELLVEDERLFEKISKVKDKDEMIECLRFKDLNYDQIISALKCIQQNTKVDNELTKKILFTILNEVGKEDLEKLFSKKDILEDFLSKSILDHLKNLNPTEGKCERFLRNLNTLVDQYRGVCLEN